MRDEGRIPHLALVRDDGVDMDRGIVADLNRASNLHSFLNVVADADPLGKVDRRVDEIDELPALRADELRRLIAGKRGARDRVDEGAAVGDQPIQVFKATEHREPDEILTVPALVI